MKTLFFTGSSNVWFWKHYQREILLFFLIIIILSTWFIFYRPVSKRSERCLYGLLVLAGLQTTLGGWEVYHRFHELPVYLSYVGVPFIVITVTSIIMIRDEIHNVWGRTILSASFFLSMCMYSFYLLNEYTPIFALVNWGK